MTCLQPCSLSFFFLLLHTSASRHLKQLICSFGILRGVFAPTAGWFIFQLLRFSVLLWNASEGCSVIDDIPLHMITITG